MAFDIQGFGRSSSNYNNRTGGGIHTYITDDDLATVEASGYFNAIVGIANIDNFILVKASDGEKLLKITSSTTPITVEESDIGGGFNFASGAAPGIPTIVGHDSVLGDLWEVKNINAGAFVDTGAKLHLVVDASADVDWSKPVTFDAYAMDVAEVVQLPYFKGADTIQIIAVEDVANRISLASTTNFDATSLTCFVTAQFYKN